MISIYDKFLPDAAFQDLQTYISESEFQNIEVGDKSFRVLQTPKYLYEFFKIPGHHLVLTFIREAHSEFDTDLRIHADHIINGHKTSIASVLYLNDPEEVSRNGTAFFDHVKYGQELPADTPIEEFNRMISEDSNDWEKWKQTDVVIARPNRLLVYGSNQFHAKWPSKIERGNRRVLVCFYAQKSELIRE